MKKALKITAKVLGIFIGSVIGFLALCRITTLFTTRDDDVYG